MKWTPNADTAIDGTLNPDFSQVESDAAPISANQRFAIFFPEKRPFFLEGVELFSTPIQAVYTRRSPRRAGAPAHRARRRAPRTRCSIADDAGGGSTIIPGPTASTLVAQDTPSTVVVARLQEGYAAASGWC